MDAVSEAGRLGIKADRAVRYRNDGAGVQRNYVAVERVVREMRGSERMEDVDDSWKSEIED